MNPNTAQLDLHRRALNRAHALAESWQGDQTAITKAQAAELLMDVIQLGGWTQSDAESERHLAVVPDRASDGGRR
jgi:hypothetical protein